MIRAVIIEDESIARHNLLEHLTLSNEDISVIAQLESVQESIDWFTNHPKPDLIFMDIHLKDGISFKIFERVKLSVPIIFITAYDNFMVPAFEQTGIEYLLKPIDTQELINAIAKYKNLKDHFLHNYDNMIELFTQKEPDKKRRIIVKRGIEFKSIPLDDVAYLFTEQKVTFLTTKEEKKFMVDKNLKELEQELDSRIFYRANRKYIININFIKSYKPYDKIKIQLELTVPVAEEIIISQESAIDFRKWISAL